GKPGAEIDLFAAPDHPALRPEQEIVKGLTHEFRFYFHARPIIPRRPQDAKKMFARPGSKYSGCFPPLSCLINFSAADTFPRDPSCCRPVRCIEPGQTKLHFETDLILTSPVRDKIYLVSFLVGAGVLLFLGRDLLPASVLVTWGLTFGGTTSVGILLVVLYRLRLELQASRHEVARAEAGLNF